MDQALKRLETFVVLVDAFEDEGKITPEEAAELRAAVETLAEGLAG